MFKASIKAFSANALINALKITHLTSRTVLQIVFGLFVLDPACWDSHVVQESINILQEIRTCKPTMSHTESEHGHVEYLEGILATCIWLILSIIFHICEKTDHVFGLA